MNNKLFKQRFEKQLKECDKWTYDQVAYYLQKSKRTVFRYVNRFNFPVHREKGTHYYFIPSEVDEWVQEHRWVLHSIAPRRKGKK